MSARDDNDDDKNYVKITEPKRYFFCFVLFDASFEIGLKHQFSFFISLVLNSTEMSHVYFRKLNLLHFLSVSFFS